MPKKKKGIKRKRRKKEPKQSIGIIPMDSCSNKIEEEAGLQDGVCEPPDNQERKGVKEKAVTIIHQK